jgi:hypothetical protein
MYMGLWDQSPPELLTWELHVKKRLIVDYVWISLHGFDLWYWWKGMWQMKRVPVPPTVSKQLQTGNRIFFPYIGMADLFDWVHIPARIFNAYMLSYLFLDFFLVSVYTIQQKRLDRAITPGKLNKLVNQWLPGLERPFSFPRIDVEPSQDSFSGNLEDSSEAQDNLCLPVQQHSRQPSTTSIKSFWSDRPDSRNSIRSQQPSPTGSRLHDHIKEKDQSSAQKIEDTAPPPYGRPTRTGTGLLKRGIMRWGSNKEPDLSTPPPLYTPYEPTFQNLYAASNLLTSSTIPSTKPPQCWKIVRKFPNYILSICKLIPVLITHPFRPSVLLALLSHARQMKHGRSATYPQVLTLALRNPAYRTANSKDVALASRVLLTLHPPPRPTRWMMIGIGWGTFAACSILIIGTELTLQWNYISGVNKIDSVGQLIPFCLGVGGLLKVIWAAVMEQDRKEDRWCYFGRCNSADRRAVWKEASEGFQKCRDAFERDGSDGSVTTVADKADV